jgi:hypothetical protein
VRVIISPGDATKGVTRMRGTHQPSGDGLDSQPLVAAAIAKTAMATTQRR